MVGGGVWLWIWIWIWVWVWVWVWIYHRLLDQKLWYLKDNDMMKSRRKMHLLSFYISVT